MPKISLVVCVHGQRDLLERLLNESTAIYDDLVVVHDGMESSIAPRTLHEKSGQPTDSSNLDFGALPEGFLLPAHYDAESDPSEPSSLHGLVRHHGGRFFQHPRVGSLEAQSPFAWWCARHDWILRLDADEVPSREQIEWLRAFRTQAEPAPEISGFTCGWPLWDGRRAVTKRWPEGRIFLFHRQRVRFFGLIEQVPIPDQEFQPLPFVLHHRPKRKSFGLGNVLLRAQAYRWRSEIARALLGQPTDLPRWRWTEKEWPLGWEQIRRRPINTALRRLLIWPIRIAGAIWRDEHKFMPLAAAGPAVHHFMIGLAHWRARRRALDRRAKDPA